MPGLYAGPGVPTEPEVLKELDVNSPGEDKRKLIVDNAKAKARKYLIMNRHDTMHPDGSYSSVCALCAGNIIRETGIVMPDDGQGSPVTHAGNIWDQISGNPYAIKRYANTEFMKNKEYENWEIISDFKNVEGGDLILFKGSGYEAMMSGHPIESNPSGYHMAISSTDYSEPGYWMGPQISGGFSVIDDQGSGWSNPIKERSKSHSSLEDVFLKAARYIGP